MNQDFKNIKAVLFDLDNVFYSYPECNEFAKKELFKFLSRETHKSTGDIKKNFDKAREIVHRDLEGHGASHSRLLYIQKCLEFLLGKTDYGISLQANNLFWKNFFEVMELRPGAIRLLKELKKKKIEIAIITNLITDIQLRKIIHLKIDPFIDFLVTSEEAGAEKLSPRIFKLALDKLKTKPREAVMIGDDYQKDILGAQNAGIKTIYFITPSEKKILPPLRLPKVKNFKELASLLGVKAK